MCLITVAMLCVLYVKQRKLEERIKNYRDGEEAVQTMQAQVDELQAEVEAGRQRVEDLRTDPVEQEAAIRRWSRKLREGETVYHVQAAPETEGSVPASPPVSEQGIPEPN